MNGTKSPENQDNVIRENVPESEQYVTFKPSSLLSICIVILSAIALAYVGGVMSGRSSAEKEYYQTMAMRNTAQTIPETVANESSPGILPPEELEFSRVLRNDNKLPSKDRHMKPVPPPKPVEKPQPPKPKTNNPETELPGEVPLATNPDPGIYDYLYQVAAVKGDDNADALRQRLEGRGLRTYMKRSGNLLLIQVKLRGTTARSEELLRILESLRLGKPFLVNKKPVRN